MADDTKTQQQSGQTNYGSQPGSQPGQHGVQTGQQKNMDPSKRNPSTGGTGQDTEHENERDRQRRAS